LLNLERPKAKNITKYIIKSGAVHFVPAEMQLEQGWKRPYGMAKTVYECKTIPYSSE
jgi:hypothetical protein